MVQCSHKQDIQATLGKSVIWVTTCEGIPPNSPDHPTFCIAFRFIKLFWSCLCCRVLVKCCFCLVQVCTCVFVPFCVCWCGVCLAKGVWLLFNFIPLFACVFYIILYINCCSLNDVLLIFLKYCIIVAIQFFML